MGRACPCQHRSRRLLLRRGAVGSQAAQAGDVLLPVLGTAAPGLDVTGLPGVPVLVPAACTSLGRVARVMPVRGVLERVQQRRVGAEMLGAPAGQAGRGWPETLAEPTGQASLSWN